MSGEAIALLRDATSRPWLANHVDEDGTTTYVVTLPSEWLDEARIVAFAADREEARIVAGSRDWPARMRAGR